MILICFYLELSSFYLTKKNFDSNYAKSGEKTCFYNRRDQHKRGPSQSCSCGNVVILPIVVQFQSFTFRAQGVVETGFSRFFFLSFSSSYLTIIKNLAEKEFK